MQMNDMILVSVDDHVCEPADMWERHLPKKWKERAPRLVTKEDGTNLWVFEGQQIPNVGLNAVAGRPPEEYGVEPRRSRSCGPAATTSTPGSTSRAEASAGFSPLQRPHRVAPSRSTPRHDDRSTTTRGILERSRRIRGRDRA